MKRPLFFLIILFISLVGCGSNSDSDRYNEIPNIAMKVMEYNTITTEGQYKEYVKNLDDWAVGEAYDYLIEIPDYLKVVDYGEESEEIEVYSQIEVESINIYACFKNVDLEEFSDFYLFKYDDYVAETEGELSDSSYAVWDEKLCEWFNPNKEHDVKNAECFIGYGYYNLKFGKTDYRYYLALKFNKEGKVEKIINNYLSNN